MDLILASTSPYRRRLLERLQIPFRCEAPATDESPLPGETPDALAHRLAMAKAASVAESNPSSLVIGSDQVASIGGSCIGKCSTGFSPSSGDGTSHLRKSWLFVQGIQTDDELETKHIMSIFLYNNS